MHMWCWLQYETALVIDLLKRGHPHAERKVRRSSSKQEESAAAAVQPAQHPTLPHSPACCVHWHSAVRWLLGRVPTTAAASKLPPLQAALGCTDAVSVCRLWAHMPDTTTTAAAAVPTGAAVALAAAQVTGPRHTWSVHTAGRRLRSMSWVHVRAAMQPVPAGLLAPPPPHHLPLPHLCLDMGSCGLLSPPSLPLSPPRPPCPGSWPMAWLLWWCAAWRLATR